MIFRDIALLAVVLGFQFFQPPSPEGEPILTVTIVRPLIIITEARGVPLSKVEIWVTPSDLKRDKYLLGIANRFEDGRPFPNKAQNWIFPIPSEPLSISQIVVKAYDLNGKVAGVTFLPEHGTKALHDVLWEDAVNQR